MPKRIDPSGVNGPTRAQARSKAWRRTGPGLFVPASVDSDACEQRIAEAAATLPAFGAVTGWSALRLWGAAYFSGFERGGRDRAPVPLAFGQGARPAPRADVHICRDWLRRFQIGMPHGIPATLPLRAAFDEIERVGSLTRAVRALDMSMAAGLFTLRQFEDYLLTCRRRPGVVLARRAAALADENAWSPPEVDTRLIAGRAGIDRLLCNRMLFTKHGQFVAVPDLLDEKAGLAIEYNGADHNLGERPEDDVRRLELVRQQRIECLVVEADDLRDRPGLIARVREARKRALWLPESERSWVVGPPFRGWSA